MLRLVVKLIYSGRNHFVYIIYKLNIVETKNIILFIDYNIISIISILKNYCQKHKLPILYYIKI